jgi:hypothetical protein
MNADSEGHSVVLPPCPCLDDRLDECFFRRTIDALNPLVCSTGGHCQCAKHGKDAEFGTLQRHLLTEENDERKRHRWNQRDDVRVFKEPAGLQNDFGSFSRCREHGLALHL